MSTTVGRLKFIVDADGRVMRQKLDKEGKAIGAEMGGGINRALNDSLNKLGKNVQEKMVRDGRFAGVKFSESLEEAVGKRAKKSRDALAEIFADPKGLQKFFKSTGDAGEAVENLSVKIKELRDNNEISKREMRLMTQAVRDARLEYEDSVKAAEALVGAKLKEKEAQREATEESRRAVVAERERARASAAAARAVEKAQKAFNLRVAKQQRDAIKVLRKEYNELTVAIGDTDSFRAYVQQSGGMERATLRMAAALDGMKASSDKSHIGLDNVGRKFFDVAREAFDAADAVDTYGGSAGNAGKQSDGFGKGWTKVLSSVAGSWRRMDGTVKLVIGTILAAAPLAASLGSALGSSLFLALGAAGALVVGLGIVITAFTGINKEADGFNERLLPAAEAIEAFQASAKELQEVIQLGFWDEFLGPMEEITNSVMPALTDSLGQIASTMGAELGKLASELASPEGIAALQGIFDIINAMLPGLVSGIGSFVSAIGGIFTAAGPFLTAFSNGFSDLMGEFDAWVQSVEGQDALEEWFKNGQTIMDALLPLVGAVAKAFSDLVTPEAIDMTVEFLNGLTDFMPILSDILEAFGQLDVGNLLVDLLLAIGEAIQPLIPSFGEYLGVLSEMAGIMIGALGEALQTVAPLFQDLLENAVAAAPAFLPLIESLFDLGITILESLIPVIQDLLPFAAEMGAIFVEDVLPVLLELAQTALPPLIEAFTDFWKKITPYLPILAELAGLIAEGVMFALQQLMPYVPMLMDVFIWLFERAIVPLIGFLEDLLGPLAEDKDAMNDIRDAISDAAEMFQDFKKIVELGQKVITSVIDAIGRAFDNLGGPIGAAVDAVQGLLGLQAQASNWRAPGGSDFTGGGGASAGGGGSAVASATGRIVRNPTQIYMGEVNAEAIVPLNRPLSQVHPDVRELSAIAQGKAMPGGGRGGRNIEAGAIVVNTSNPNERQVAQAILDRMVEDDD